MSSIFPPPAVQTLTWIKDEEKMVTSCFILEHVIVQWRKRMISETLLNFRDNFKYQRTHITFPVTSREVIKQLPGDIN